MKLTISLLAALAGSAIAADSGKPNPFKIPESGLNTKAGETLNLQWNPTTQGKVSLILRSGSSNALDQGAYIVQNIQNSGSFAWNLPSDITRGSDYTVEIVSDGDTSQMNYTPYFVIDSDNTVATQTGTVTLGAPTESLAGKATGTVSADSTSMDSSSSGSETSTGTDSTMTTSASSRGSSSSSDASTTADATASTTSSDESASTTNADASATSTEAASSTGGASANNIPLVAAGVLALGAMVL